MKKHDPNRYLTHVIKTERQSNYFYRLKVKARLNKAFNIIPTNAIVNKGRCGIGGTYLEIKARRNSIIVVPTNAIIDNKCFDNKGKLLPNYYVVRGKHKNFNYGALLEFMQSDTGHKKIFCTPAGLAKVMNCGLDRYTIYSEWFLLLDECHTAITDSFRKEILIPFNYLFQFVNKALISATPYYFSDPRFEMFDTYNIAFRGKIAKMEINYTTDVNAILFAKLSDSDQYPGRVHIFLNSVNKIAECIQRSGISDCSIFCKDDMKNRNKLDELRKFFKKTPSIKTFSKFNFYTSKYFEGWDLHDFNSTTIIVSDYNCPTLKTGVSNKCVQAAGRNRSYSNKIIHITNSRGINRYDSIDYLQDRLLKQAQSAIEGYNSHVSDTKVEDFDVNEDFKLAVLIYGNENKISKKVSLDSNKLDQIVNVQYSNQQYNHIGHITTAWKEAYYSVTMNLVIVPPIPEYEKRLSRLNKILRTVEYLKSLEINCNNDFLQYKELAKLLPIETDYIREAYNVIGLQRMEAVAYNVKLMREEVIRTSNVVKKEYVKQDYWNLVGSTFKRTAEITKILTHLYSKYKVYNPKKSVNEPEKVYAATLDELFTDVVSTKDEQRRHGRYINIY